MKLWMWIVLGVIVGVPAIAFGVGSLLPRNHVARMTIDLTSAPERVWSLISDFENMTKWRTDVKSVTISSQPGGPFRYTESTSMGDIPFEVVSQDPPRQQVVRVIDDDQPFGGTWTFDLEPTGSGTKVTITEAGFVKNPAFRFMGLFFFSPTDTIDSYLRALAKALGEGR